MSTVKTTFTQTNKLYGDTEVSGYGRGGLVTHKVKRGWSVSHGPSGMQISSKAVRPTRAAAEAMMEELLALDIKWELPWEEMIRAFSVNATDIRAICGA